MADGHVHLSYWKMGIPAAILLGLALFVFSGNVLLGFAFFAGYLLGYMVDPDLDMCGMTDAKKRWKDTVVLYPVYIWWRVYSATLAHILGGHRSFMNHAPGISTAIRLVWLFAPICILWYLIFGTIPCSAEMAIVVLLGVWAGLSLSDFVHGVLDIL